MQVKLHLQKFNHRIKLTAMTLFKTYTNCTNTLSKFKDLPLLFIRLILAYGFFNPALMKWQDLNGIADWFREMNIPAPLISAYLSAGTEALGVMLLVLGLGTRLIAIPLSFLLLVAIIKVHWVNGFEAGNNGYEIPLYYLIMLFALLVYGAGRISLDYALTSYSKLAPYSPHKGQTA
jgi:putative oxidoreductase